MKTKLFTLLFALAAGIVTLFASDTQVNGIWYDFDSSSKSATVTYRGSSYSAYSDEYTGLVAIPASVTYNNVKYSVTSIGSRAFQNCTGLTYVTIPNSVTSIGTYAFCGCSGLTYAEIPNSVTTINSAAFRECTSMTAVPLQNSITSIGTEAFMKCTSLTSVTIPNSVTRISNYTFQSCTSLTSVTIPNSVTSIGERAFVGCSGLTSVTIPNSVTSIGAEAFESCTGLTSITIPNSVTSIGGLAFDACSGLTSVTILSDDFETEGGSIFINCSNLTHMSGPAKMLYMTDFYLSMYTISRRLKNVIITGGEMTENEFLALHEAYKSLESVDMSAASNTTLSDEAFKDCYNLTELKLPASLTKINYMAVAGCKNLQSIDIPASVEEIEQSAFEDCRSLQSITFGGANPAPGRFNAPAAASQLKRIGNWAFYNAHELQHLTIPEGVTEIGDGAFYGCTYLEDLVLPSSVRAIGDNCFALCSKLTKIVVNSTTPPEIEAKTFYDVKRQIPVYVPDEAVSAYEADTYWQEFDIQGASKMPTGIEDVSSSLQGGDRGRLILRNGQVFILRGEKVYTVTGMEVK